MARQRTILSSSFAAIVLVTAACSSGDDDSGGAAGNDGTTAAAALTTTSSVSGVSDVDPTLPFPADRCAANQAAGTITYLSSFDYAAAASIVEVIVAEQKGYFDALCLDVEMAASFSTANYPLDLGERGAVLLRRLVQRGARLRRQERGRPRRARRRGPHGHRRIDHEGRRDRVARRRSGIDDRGQGQDLDERGGDARRRSA